MDGPPGRAALFSERGTVAPGARSRELLATPRAGGYGTARPRASLPPVFWFFFAGGCTPPCPVAVCTCLVTAPFAPRRAILHRFTCFWASLYTWLNPAWPVRIDGRERVRPGVTYVMVANHQSFLDILALFRLFVHFKWVSKIEIFS